LSVSTRVNDGTDGRPETERYRPDPSESGTPSISSPCFEKRQTDIRAVSLGPRGISGSDRQPLLRYSSNAKALSQLSEEACSRRKHLWLTAVSSLNGLDRFGSV